MRFRVIGRWRAALRAVLILCLAACEAATASTDAERTLLQLVLTPATATLATGGSQQFAVAGIWSEGSTDVPPVEYSATGGGISATGEYVGGSSAGSFVVVARHAASGLADTSTVTLTAVAPPTLTQLSLTPSTASMAVGATQQFAVSGVWSDGSTGAPPVTYSATGGTITAAGLYTAGGTAGTFRAVALHTGSGLADTSAVTITAAAPPATIYLQEGFEDNAAATRGWYDNTAFTTTTAEFRPGGTRSLAWTWAIGQQLPAFGGAARHAIAATESLYVSFWIKYSANWVGSGVGYHPHEFYFLTTASTAYTGPSYTPLTTYIEHNYQNGGIPIVATSDGANIDVTRLNQDLTAITESRATAGCNGNSDGIATDCYSIGGGLYNNGKKLFPAGAAPAFLPNPGPGYKNDWHHIEVVLRMNSVVGGIGQLDGVVQYWFDGTLLIDRRNILFRTGARSTMRWNQFLLGPYIGPGSPVVQTTWIDDLLIANRKP